MTIRAGTSARTIVILSVARGYGGGERSLEELLIPLGQDFRARLLVENRRHERHCLAAIGGRGVSHLPGAPQFFQMLYGAIWTVLQYIAHRPAFILANSNKSALILAFVARLLPSIGPRTILYIRDFQWRFLPFIIRHLPGALVLVPSHAVIDRASYLTPLLARGTVRTAIVPNIAAFPQTGLAAGPVGPAVVMLGAIHPWKGQEYLIRALSLLPPSVTAAIHGEVHDPAYFVKLERLIAELGLGERVTFHLFTDKVHEVVSQALCVAVTSLSDFGGPETFGRVVLDAWVASRPVVAFDVGGPHYLIRDEDTGLLVPEGDWRALGAAIGRLVADPALANRLGKAGAAEAHTQYDPATVYDSFWRAVGPCRDGQQAEQEQGG